MSLFLVLLSSILTTRNIVVRRHAPRCSESPIKHFIEHTPDKVEISDVKIILNMLDALREFAFQHPSEVIANMQGGAITFQNLKK